MPSCNQVCEIVNKWLVLFYFVCVLFSVPIIVGMITYTFVPRHTCPEGSIKSSNICCYSDSRCYVSNQTNPTESEQIIGISVISVFGFIFLSFVCIYCMFLITVYIIHIHKQTINNTQTNNK